MEWAVGGAAGTEGVGARREMGMGGARDREWWAGGALACMELMNSSGILGLVYFLKNFAKFFSTSNLMIYALSIIK